MNYYVGFVTQTKDHPHPVIEVASAASGFAVGQLVRMEQLGPDWLQVQQVYSEVIPEQLNTTVLLGTIAPASALSSDDIVPALNTEAWRPSM